MTHEYSDDNPTKGGEGTPRWGGGVNPLRGPETVIYREGKRRRAGGGGEAEQRGLTYDVIGTLTSVTSPGRSPISLPGQSSR